MTRHDLENYLAVGDAVWVRSRRKAGPPKVRVCKIDLVTGLVTGYPLPSGNNPVSTLYEYRQLELSPEGADVRKYNK